MLYFIAANLHAVTEFVHVRKVALQLFQRQVLLAQNLPRNYHCRNVTLIKDRIVM